MASPAIRLRMIRLLVPLIFAALPAAMPARAADDSAHALQRDDIAGIEVETTGALPPYPGEALRTEAVDMDRLKSAVTAYRRGSLRDGDAIAQTIDDRTARALLEWVAIRSGASLIPFARIDAFLKAHPNYPATSLFRRRAEEMLIAEKKSPAVIRAFFHGQRPVSPAGRIALALTLKAEGRIEEANTLARQSWLQDHLGGPLEAIVLDAFGAALSPADHRLRAERYIFRGNSAAALRNAARVSPDYVLLARARLASGAARRPIAPALIAAVPASLRGDISFAFLQAQQARRADKPIEAAAALANVPRDPALLGDGDGWWIERRLIARELLDEGDAARAYGVAAGHGAEDAAERIDAEWHSGFIALRFRDQPGIALEHFNEAARHAETPISVSRAAYWQGRAFEAIGKADEAQSAYERAAEHPIAYYGQLARARLRLPDLPLRRSVAAALQHLPGHRGVRLLYGIGERDLAVQMLTDLAQRLHTTPALEALATIAQREGDTRALLALGKAALQRGLPLDAAAFPTTGVPEFAVLGDPMERAIVHAIARQESAFDPTAISHAGARGLMQMMPATARETARRANLPFDWPRLGRDALYSAQMGAAHLNDLLKEWRGSYILTFAAYNAGSGNVRKWIAAYGDPRLPEVDAVDWVERIPFYETRNYVQRVMENLQVYRQRLNQRTAYLIDHDLKRGGRRD
ncbi:lytic transglycosylase domain-containing protein [Bosea sp. (in: a-proteobacteria)]|uniref:lytic transglycosylase domain-containing protein n=1 Tax=Bosea sp. (in: a-proteobacteria) TaxID=1871050 RepID=UPI0027326CE6|nr:lytic transglycosylase domain-containing protein [Bosea sp. (in: a-proteobacteria)]MDP3409283.1 lytic transglycosylase domain-containing protein [Bosea sp. (in: a-proteobacteria)]